MENFLRKYSKVPNGFIDDFFHIAKESYRSDEFTIDFDVVAKWLCVQKGHLKEVLLRNFEEGYDYTMEKIKIIKGTSQ